MFNYDLANLALVTATEYCHKHNITQDSISLLDRIINWYENTDITNAEMLAALALEFSSFEPLPYSILEQVTEMYFPTFAMWEF